MRPSALRTGRELSKQAKDDPASRQLPPPPNTILWFVLRGWANEHPFVAVAPLSRMPVGVWQAPLRRIMADKDGMERMKALALAGLRRYSDDAGAIEALARAFDHKELEQALREALDDFAKLY
jgi:hypothetical protein